MKKSSLFYCIKNYVSITACSSIRKGGTIVPVGVAKVSSIKIDPTVIIISFGYRF